MIKIENLVDIIATLCRFEEPIFASEDTNLAIMKTMRFLLLMTSVISFNLFLASCGYEDEEISIVPVPVSVKCCNGNFLFTSETVISVDDASLKPTAEWFAWLFARPAGFVPKVVVGKNDADVRLSLVEGMSDEAYMMQVNRHHITIEASDRAGFIYALQTLRLALPSEMSSGRYVENVQWSVHSMKVYDMPRFSHRCLRLNLDKCRFTDAQICYMLDCMAMLKYNYLHLYASDVQNIRACAYIDLIESHAEEFNIKVGVTDNKCFCENLSSEPEWIEPLVSMGKNSLKDIYYYEPESDSASDDFHDFLMGLFSSVWFQSCSESEQIQGMLLPHLAALAETAWSPKGCKDWKRFSASVADFRKHLASEF